MEKREKDANVRAAATRGNRLWIWVGGAAVAAAVVAGFFAYRVAMAQPGASLPDQGTRHVQTLNEPIPPYNSDPPTSGPHLPYIAPWGIHTEPIPRELQVHNLEDGGVVVQYRCATPCPDLVDQLARIVRRYETQVILAPYPGMRTHIALTAWTRLDAFDDFDEARLERFIRALRGNRH